MTKLFTPLQIGNVTLAHRIVMAPLTRFRADDKHVQLPMATEYYCQRASIPETLIIAERYPADEWGGSIENRARFAIEVATSIANAIGSDKLGYRISPWSTFQGMRMSYSVPQFSYLIEKLRDLKLAYLHVIESRVTNNVDIEKTGGFEFDLDIWGKCSPVLVAGGYTPENAKHVVDRNYVNNEAAVVFGRHFLANPDLPFRIQQDIPLKTATGYTDYSFSPEFLAKHKR